MRLTSFSSDEEAETNKARSRSDQQSASKKLPGRNETGKS